MKVGPLQLQITKQGAELAALTAEGRNAGLLRLVSQSQLCSVQHSS